MSESTVIVCIRKSSGENSSINSFCGLFNELRIPLSNVIEFLPFVFLFLPITFGYHQTESQWLRVKSMSTCGWWFIFTFVRRILSHIWIKSFFLIFKSIHFYIKCFLLLMLNWHWLVHSAFSVNVCLLISVRTKLYTVIKIGCGKIANKI